MKRKYPRLVNWLIFQNMGDQRCLVTDIMDDTRYIVPNREAWFMQQLDGHTDPYEISGDFSFREVHRILRTLNECGLLRRGRILTAGPGTALFTLWTAPCRQPNRKPAVVLNRLLMCLFLPVFLGGAYLFIDIPSTANFSVAGLILGLACGMVLHETGHIIASLAYGGLVFEAGLQFSTFLPGAYIMSDERLIKSRLKRAQFFAAGIEMNLLLAGILSGMSCLLQDNSGILRSAAAANFVVSIGNCIFISTLDGFRILSELLGMNNLMGWAKKNIKSWKRLRTLMNDGVESQTALFVSYFVYGMRYIYPLMLLIELGELILWFV